MAFGEIVGKTIERFEQDGDDLIRLWFVDGSVGTMYHEHDCCEHVYIESIAGNIDDIIGTPILKAEEVVSENVAPDGMESVTEHDDSFTWTFYHIVTAKGYITLRWLGVSNGYYSENVSFEVTRGGRRCSTS